MTAISDQRYPEDDLSGDDLSGDGRPVDDLSAYAARLEQAKVTNPTHQIVKAARLINESRIKILSEDPRFEGVRMAHLAVMPHLDLEGTRLTELARRMGLTKQAVGQVITELESRGVVERRPDPADGRARLVTLTEMGRGFLLEGLDLLAEVNTVMAEVIGAEGLDRLCQALTAIIERLQADQG